jgi:hypothetical protein
VCCFNLVKKANLLNSPFKGDLESGFVARRGAQETYRGSVDPKHQITSTGRNISNLRKLPEWRNFWSYFVSGVHKNLVNGKFWPDFTVHVSSSPQPSPDFERQVCAQSQTWQTDSI